MHKHEWKEKYNELGHYGSTHIICECKEIMPSAEIERRLNATEELSAEIIDLINKWYTYQLGGFEINKIRVALRACVKKMEKK